MTKNLLWVSPFFHFTPPLHKMSDNGKLYAPGGVFEDALSSPATYFAKADNQKRCKPARMVHTACYRAFLFMLY